MKSKEALMMSGTGSAPRLTAGAMWSCLALLVFGNAPHRVGCTWQEAFSLPSAGAAETGAAVGSAGDHASRAMAGLGFASAADSGSTDGASARLVAMAASPASEPRKSNRHRSPGPRQADCSAPVVVFVGGQMETPAPKNRRDPASANQDARPAFGYLYPREQLPNDDGWRREIIHRLEEVLGQPLPSPDSLTPEERAFLQKYVADPPLGEGPELAVASALYRIGAYRILRDQRVSTWPGVREEFQKLKAFYRASGREHEAVGPELLAELVLGIPRSVWQVVAPTSSFRQKAGGTGSLILSVVGGQTLEWMGASLERARGLGTAGRVLRNAGRIPTPVGATDWAQFAVSWPRLTEGKAEGLTTEELEKLTRHVTDSRMHHEGGRVLAGFRGMPRELWHLRPCMPVPVTSRDVRIAYSGAGDWLRKHFGDTSFFTLGRSGSALAILCYSHDPSGSTPDQTLAKIRQTTGALRELMDDVSHDRNVVVLVGDPTNSAYESLKNAMEAEGYIIGAEVESRGKTLDEIYDEAAARAEEVGATLIVFVQREGQARPTPAIRFVRLPKPEPYLPLPYLTDEPPRWWRPWFGGGPPPGGGGVLPVLGPPFLEKEDQDEVRGVSWNVHLAARPEGPTITNTASIPEHSGTILVLPEGQLHEGPGSIPTPNAANHWHPLDPETGLCQLAAMPLDDSLRPAGEASLLQIPVFLDERFQGALVVGDWVTVADVVGEQPDALLWPVVRLALGHAMLAQNRGNEAATLFGSVSQPPALDAWDIWTSMLLRLHPDSAAAHYLHGDALARLGRWDDALAEFSKALERDPLLHLARNARGITYAAKGMSSQAITELTELTITAPGFADGHASLGAVWVLRRAPDGAAVAARKALDNSPEFALADNTLGCAVYGLGQWDQARSHLEKAAGYPDAAIFQAASANVLALLAEQAEFYGNPEPRQLLPPRNPTLEPQPALATPQPVPEPDAGLALQPRRPSSRPIPVARPFTPPHQSRPQTYPNYQDQVARMRQQLDTQRRQWESQMQRRYHDIGGITMDMQRALADRGDWPVGTFFTLGYVEVPPSRTIEPGKLLRQARDFVNALAEFQKQGQPLVVEVTSPEATLGAEERTAGTVSRGELLHVTQVSGKWLWVESVEGRQLGKGGWIDQKHVR